MEYPLETNITTVQLCPMCQWTSTNTINKNAKKHHPKRYGPRYRAGVVLHNKEENKILLVQVYNEFIGLPKGGKEVGETSCETALRELEEETGIHLTGLDESNKVVYDHTCTYYILETTSCYPVCLHKFEGNDVTGVGWVHLDCISKIQGKVTSHLDRILRKIRKEQEFNLFPHIEC